MSQSRLFRTGRRNRPPPAATLQGRWDWEAVPAFSHSAARASDDGRDFLVGVLGQKLVFLPFPTWDCAEDGEVFSGAVVARPGNCRADGALDAVDSGAKRATTKELAAGLDRTDAAAEPSGQFIVRPRAEQLVVLGPPTVATGIWN